MRRFYALLLTAYPAAFRRRFGAELALAFEAGLAQARAHGWFTTIRYLLASAVDAIGSGAGERRSNRWYSPRAARDPLMATFLHDMAFGLRLLRRNPVSLYSIAHGTLIAPLPFRDEARVVMMYEHAPQKGTIRGNVAPANFLDWRARTSSFAAMGH